MIRRDGKFLCSEALAYRELTGADITKFELHEMLMMDNVVNSTLYKLRNK